MLVLQIAAGVFIGLAVFHFLKHASAEALGNVIAFCMGGVLLVGMGCLFYMWPELLLVWLALVALTGIFIAFGKLFKILGAKLNSLKIMPKIDKGIRYIGGGFILVGIIINVLDALIRHRP